MTTAVQVLLPVGRLVGGDAYSPRTKDNNGNLLTIKKGPDAGKPRVDYGLAIAIAKTPGHRAWWETQWGLEIYQAANAANPQAVALAVGELQAGRDPGKFFSFKITDGDSTMPNGKGKKPCDNEGYPGHWVLWLGSSYAPRIVTADGSKPILEPGAVKRGYFVQAYITVKGNESADSPGVYLNHGYVALSGYGPEISSGPDPTQIGFGGALPAGASAVPVTTMNTPAPGAPAPAVGLPPPPGAPVNVAAPVLPPVTAVVPHAAILAPQTAPPPPPVAAAPVVPVVPVVPAVPVMTAKAAGATFEQFKANGWTEDQLRQNGYIV